MGRGGTEVTCLHDDPDFAPDRLVDELEREDR